MNTLMKSQVKKIPSNDPLEASYTFQVFVRSEKDRRGATYATEGNNTAGLASEG